VAQSLRAIRPWYRFLRCWGVCMICSIAHLRHGTPKRPTRGNVPLDAPPEAVNPAMLRLVQQMLAERAQQMAPTYSGEGKVSREYTKFHAALLQQFPQLRRVPRSRPGE